MADVSYSIALNVDKGFLRNSVNVSNVTAAMGSVGMQSTTFTLTTNASSISTVNLSSVGMAFVRNLSQATGMTAQIGIEAGGSFVALTTLRAGEPAIFRMASGTNYKAIGVAGTRLRVDITEG